MPDVRPVAADTRRLVLKGGDALEMRFHMAWSTKDLDLTIRSAQGRAGDSISLRERLQLAAAIDLPDFFAFIVGEAMAELNQAPEGGARFPVDARLDGRTFVKLLLIRGDKYSGRCARGGRVEVDCQMNHVMRMFRSPPPPRRSARSDETSHHRR